ncbi:50S ribosomal protein L33 [Paenibacillus sp. 5J-6]|uniref:50S ribosomal protein L33 n=1 Tax=Paenibacillus silvestris TaxID=2606219 RepID=A0A6L8V218_9BACL|nr:50S ribosomal protein L33 [Paenibacillus silvestris]MZQ83596.1 50S ribosomal protein L33 [Paenibacillus silvestris]
MASQIRKSDVRKLVGKQIVALKKDGTSVSGKLVRISGNTLIVSPQKGKKVQVKAIIPLVLFDLLAIGTAPFGFGGGFGYGGFGPGFGGGFGPGFGGFGGGFGPGFGGFGGFW